MLFLEFRGAFNFPSEDRSYLHIFLLHGISVFNLLNKYLLSNYSVCYHWGSKMNEYSCVFKGYSLVRRAALWTDDCIGNSIMSCCPEGETPTSSTKENHVIVQEGDLWLRLNRHIYLIIHQRLSPITITETSLCHSSWEGHNAWSCHVQSKKVGQ